MTGRHAHLGSPSLNRLVLDYLIHRIVSGDIVTSDQLGIDSRMRRQLIDLRAADLGRLAGLRGCVRVSVDVQALARMLDHLAQERRQQGAVEELVRRDAPNAMLLALFQLTSREVTVLRQALGLPGSPGRTRQATEEEELRIWSALRDLRMDSEALRPEDWLALHDETGIPLRILWSAVTNLRDDETRRRATS